MEAAEGSEEEVNRQLRIEYLRSRIKQFEASLNTKNKPLWWREAEKGIYGKELSQIVAEVPSIVAIRMQTLKRLKAYRKKLAQLESS